MRSKTIGLKRARSLRRAMRGGELGLWVRLRAGQLGGYHFRRQHPVGPYILDFYCAAARLAIEIDGYSHTVDGAAAHDARRDAWLRGQGIDTVRISAELAKDPGAVAQMILDEVQRRAPQSLRDSSAESGGGCGA